MRIVPILFNLDSIAPVNADVNLVKNDEVVTVNLHSLFDSIIEKRTKPDDHIPDSGEKVE